MPAKDGTGPLGQGSRTGRGMGNCNTTKARTSQSSTPGNNQPFGWGGRLWNITFGHLFGRRHSYRTNRK